MRSKSKRDVAGAALRRSGSRFRTSVDLTANRLVQATRELLAPERPRPASWSIEPLEPRVLLSGDAVPGVHRIEGSIDQPGEQDSYQFVVDQTTRMLFDGVQGNQIQWQLQGPAGAASFSSRDLQAGADPFLELAAGTYKLNVQAQGDSTGGYVFRLFGEASATPLTPNQPVTGVLPAGNQAALYAVTVQAGDRLFFQAGQSDPGVSWSLYDNHANVVAGSSSVNYDRGYFVAATGGTYWLSVEGIAGSTATPSYGFTLFKQSPQVSSLVLGQSAAAALNQPGAAAAYQFDVTQAGLLAWDQLSAGAYGVSWSIQNALGQTVGSGNTAYQDGSANPIAVQAGHYTLTLSSTDRNPVPIQFRLLHSAMGQTLANDQLLNLSASSGREGRVYHIAAGAPTNISLAALLAPDAPAGTSLVWAITDRRGTMIGNGYLADQAAANVRLAAAGDYYLWVDGSANNAAGFSGQLRVNAWVDQQVTLGALAAGSASDFSGNLVANGQSKRFDFDLPASGFWALNSVQAPAGAQWQLIGPDGTVVNWRNLAATQGTGSAALYLSSGHYALTVKAAQGIGGAFDLKARPGSSVAELVSGTPAALPDLALGESVWFRSTACTT